MFWVIVSYINKPKYVCRKISKHAKVSDTLCFYLLEYAKENTRLLFVSSKSNLLLKHL